MANKYLFLFLLFFVTSAVWSPSSSAALIQDIFACPSSDCSSQFHVGSIEFPGESGNGVAGVKLNLSFPGNGMTESDIQTIDWEISSANWLLTSLSLDVHKNPDCMVGSVSPDLVYPCESSFFRNPVLTQPGMFDNVNYDLSFCDIVLSQIGETVACIFPQLIPVSFNFVPRGEPLSPIPIPAGVWLFGTALIGLVGFGKQKKAA